MNESALAASDFVDLSELRERLGITRSTLRRRMDREGLEVFADPADERVRLIRRRDAEALLRPRLAIRKSKHDLVVGEVGPAADNEAT
jgi:DNA-binding MarR family transcriptional regulator